MGTKTTCVFGDTVTEVMPSVIYEAFTKDGDTHIGFIGHNMKEFYILYGGVQNEIGFNPVSLYVQFKKITEKFTIEFN